MLTITIEVNARPGQAIGIKEQIAMDLERYGDTKVISVQEIEPEQLRIGRQPSACGIEWGFIDGTPGIMSTTR